MLFGFSHRLDVVAGAAHLVIRQVQIEWHLRSLFDKNIIYYYLKGIQIFVVW